MSGTEYGPGLIGNTASGLTALPMLEVDYSALPKNLPRLLSYASKVDPSSPYWTDIRFQAAALDASVSSHSRLKASCSPSCARKVARRKNAPDPRSDRLLTQPALAGRRGASSAAHRSARALRD